MVVSLHRACPSHYEVRYVAVFCLTELRDDFHSFAAIGEALEHAVTSVVDLRERLLVSFCPSVDLSILTHKILETV
jgi:hypothetical protein